MRPTRGLRNDQGGNHFLQSFLGLALICAVVAVHGVPAPASAQESLTGNVNLFLGGKALDEDDWAPVEDQGEAAIEFDFRPRPWPINMVLGIRKSSDDGTAFDPIFGSADVEGETSEFNLGIRKIWEELPYIRPFIGGGLALVDAEYKASFSFGSASDSDSALGLWLGGGVYWTVADHLNLGVDLRFSGADVTLFGVDGKAGGRHLGVLLGYHF